MRAGAAAQHQHLACLVGHAQEEVPSARAWHQALSTAPAKRLQLRSRMPLRIGRCLAEDAACALAQARQHLDELRPRGKRVVRVAAAAGGVVDTQLQGGAVRNELLVQLVADEEAAESVRDLEL